MWQSKHDTKTAHVHDDECTKMFPIKKTVRENVHKTRVNVEIARMFIE